MTNDDTKRTFDDLVAAAGAAAPIIPAYEEEREQREQLTARFKRALDDCLDPVIATACALRYEASTDGPMSRGVRLQVEVRAVLTVDGEPWVLRPNAYRLVLGDIRRSFAWARFSFAGPSQFFGTADPATFQTALLTAIAQRRKQRASADDSA